ncbi:MAG: T9SS type B sorting domain-containing protein, partial [Flavobacteriales bacterium]
GLLDTVICAGSSVQLHAPDALQYAWQAANGITTLNVQDPIVTPSEPTTYTVQLLNACGSIFDDVFVDLIFVNAAAWPDTLVCPGQPVLLIATGGVGYAWGPVQGLSDPDSSVTTALATANTAYSVIVTDINGCQDTAFALIELYPYPTVYAGYDVIIDWHDEVQLNATGNGILTWSPPDWLDTIDGSSPIASPEESIAYTVMVTDTNGCTATDEVLVIINGSLYVPNAFTPNGDGYNDGFGAWGKDIRDMELLVFNRWGELIWSTTKLNDRWDGTYKGVASPIDTYVWKVEATEISGRKRNAIGHVTLVR